ncbi:TPA: PucR family transcriptional regulator ligand-binding domain-containing protein, partial [Klebsiella pneumoniae]
MPLSIRDIIDTPALATRLLCGAAGLERPVRWAHVCELDDPSEWLGEGDLLMTTGLGLPDTPAAQQAYVERLAEARLSGIMIGEHMQAPANLEALCAAAEAHGLPVLMTRYSVHFSAVTRRVIEAGKREEFERLATINRLYESARLGLRGLGTAALLERLGRDLHCRLYVLETGSLEPWLPGLPAVEPALQARLGQRLQQQRGSPTHVLRVAVDGQSAWW